MPLAAPRLFDHEATGFALEGMHGTVECLTCHQQLVLANIGSSCADCHVDPHSGALGFACGECHGMLSRDPRFGLTEFHDGTGFPLTGAHRALECGACHGGTPPFDFQLTPLECLGCHRAEQLEAQPDHVRAAFAAACEECHRTDHWIPVDVVVANLDHDGFFPLRGAHVALDCASCHEERFDTASTDCVTCHQADYLAARDPDHLGLGLETDCSGCHGSESWSGATRVEHDAYFALAGVHTMLPCEACHASGYAGTPRHCSPCHEADFAAARDPDHFALGLSLSCETCHGEAHWEVVLLDHDPFFPLRGAHVGPGCEACHDSGFSSTEASCLACHAADFNAATNPDHVAAAFPVECEDCHSTQAWSGGAFDHSYFPHLGGHRGLDCTDCHADQYAGTSRECITCHESDYRSAQPDHLGAGFPRACELCHDIFGWDGAAFDHSSFPLRQGHRGLDCFDCHEAGGFDQTPSECFACHEDDYRSAAEPDHAGAGFPIYCEDCHGVSDWEATKFDHDRLYFPIYNGSHDGVWDTCATCHLDPRDLSFFECLLCHQHNQPDTDADHQGVEGYQYESRACLGCHSILPG